MNKNKVIINHIKTYTTFEWLLFIKILENKTKEDMYILEQDDIERNLLENSNWYLILVDLAIRFSDYQRTKVIMNNLPTKFDYRKFISLYLNCEDNETNFKKDLLLSMQIAIARYGQEQLKRYSPIVNNFGRLLDLYKGKESLFKQFLGLSPKQILYFATLNNGKHNIYEPFDFVNMLRLLKEYDSKITEKHLCKFLKELSLTIKEYRLKSKELGNTKDKVKTVRLIEQFPIIELSNNFYFIPSINALIESLTYKIFYTLNNLQVNQQNFKREFGNTFENYTRRLTKFSHNEYFNECNDLIVESKKEKAEYYLLKNDSTIVVESKLLPIDENIILNGQIKNIEDAFIGTIDKALSQIQSTFNAIHAENKYAIIVIHTHMFLSENYINLIRNRLNYNFLDNVVILSVIDYEILIHNPFENIIEYFRQAKDSKKQQVSLFFNNKNKYLEEVFYNVCEELKEQIKQKDI
jgi:hypothetical protein